MRLPVLAALQVLLLVYSAAGVLGKFAASHPFPSAEFALLYLGAIACLGAYALGWQQVLKRAPLTVAFANKAVTVVWGIVWGAMLFGEAVSWQMVAGAALIMAGVVLFSFGGDAAGGSGGGAR